MKVILLGYGESIQSVEPFLTNDEVYIYDERVMSDKRYISLILLDNGTPQFPNMKVLYLLLST